MKSAPALPQSHSKLSEELQEVYTAHARRLRAIGGKSNAQDADDVIHDAVVKTLSAGRRQRIRDPLRFLSKVARNTVLSSLRDRLRREGPSIEDSECFADSAASAEQQALTAERLDRALDSIGRMPARRREALLLHRIEGLSYSEVAQRMDITVKAVEKHLSLAMAQLHQETRE